MTGVLLVALVLLAEQIQRPAGPPPPTGTAIIRGLVTDRETGAPIPRAIVSARAISPFTVVRQALSDQDGRFELTNLPAGRYEINVSPGENRATHTSQLFRDPSSPERGGGVVINDGENRTNVDIALPRALAISGRVVDEFGDPLVEVGVGARPEGSRSRGSSGRPASTDDRGMFRLYGLNPGRYIVCVDLSMRPQMRGTPSVERFVRTCHPSATSDSEAQPVFVSNHDVEGVEIRVRRSKAFTISGTVVDANGMPVERPHVGLTQHQAYGASSIATTGFTDGRFQFGGLAPGDYTVTASVGHASGGVPDARPTQGGYAAVRLDADDVEGLAVMLKAPASVDGRVIFEDAPPAKEGAAITVTSRADDRAGIETGTTLSERLTADNTFTLTGLFGRRRLSVDRLPRGWAVKSIRYRGADITYDAVEFVTDPRHQIDVTVTSRVAIVSGTVADDTGKPAPGVRVLIVPAAATQMPPVMQHNFPSTMSARDGRFTLPGVAPGDYLIVALAQPPEGLLDPRETFERYAKYAERVTLVENDRLTMNLRVVTLKLE